MPELTPQDISNQQFRSVFRGFDPAEVRSYLDGLAQSVAQLAKERESLNERLAEVGERDLKSEFESIGREVAAVLEAAREAADQLRQRASNDATRWRSEAVAEAEQSLRQARSDSERLRGDAWSTADELLKQGMAEADRIQATTEKERLRLVGEAERESHRVVAAGRREAEDLVRNAKMESERLTLTAQTNHDETIEQATRQADAAQERTRALEIRRQELKAELDSIRHALATAEGELEERRSALALSPQTPDPSPVAAPDAIVQREVAKEEFAKKNNVDISEIGAYFITPCPAKMTSIKSPLAKDKSDVDGAISILEVYGLLTGQLKSAEAKPFDAMKATAKGIAEKTPRNPTNMKPGTK